MLALISIRCQSPESNFIGGSKGGFVSIKFKVEYLKDMKLLLRIFNDYLNSTFCGSPPIDNDKGFNVVLKPNEVYRIYYSYQKAKTTIKLINNKQNAIKSN